ncbi:Uncharacterised protein [Vibrio cholerae]|nr:Uncharacterised protein [Vibrio cholerae]
MNDVRLNTEFRQYVQTRCREKTKPFTIIGIGLIILSIQRRAVKISRAIN